MNDILNTIKTHRITQHIREKFDAVRMMREIRDKLSEIYTKDPEAEKRDLEAINVKYGIKG
jgi:hypothetical protein